jgi:nitrogen fixation/metabolism regulation signal transduction histidine kinase
MLALFLLFAIGALVATMYIKNTTTEVNHLISLHQIKGFRQNLIIYIQAAQSDLHTVNTPSSLRLHSVMQNVSSLEQASHRCITCHHSPEISKKIDGLEALISDYTRALKGFIAASADMNRMDKIRLEAMEIGNRLLIDSEEMSFQASSKLESMTIAAMDKINNARMIVYLTILLTCVLGIIIAVKLTMTITRPIKELVNATRAITSGELGSTVSYSDKTEFGELIYTFNTMSVALKDGYNKLQEEINERKMNS